ncbi:MAG TPA: hypothetical protein VIE67_04790 [Rudaea sp.]|jgi:hypothetical protein|uniref:glycan biosynthesis hexose transferase WsfD n=1 Tax=Rudaea sp. TaxID=2136325 RepID=UPI002F93F2AC
MSAPAIQIAATAPLDPAPIDAASPGRGKRALIPADTPRWLLFALAACLLVGLLRIGALYLHTPLIALANSYDEVRYSACLDLYPARAVMVPPTRNSPQAPYSRYQFIAAANPICYWSSELLFQGAAAAVYRLDAARTGARDFSVRWIGAFKIIALLGIWLAFSVAWLRRREPWSALANGLLLPILFADPANTIYLNTFYAEWTAMLALYAVAGLILVHEGKPARGHAFGPLAIAASALALSKIQHIVLPLGCAVAMLAIGRWRDRVWLWKGKALLLGALVGLVLQVVQLQRDSEAIRAINIFNRADVVFTALLPNARDPAATARRLGLSPQCLQYSGLHAWQMPGFPADLCPELADVTRTRELLILLREPDMTLRIGWHGLVALNPWLAPGLGLVERGDFARLPPGFFSLSAPLSALPLLRVPLFGAPFLAVALLLWRQRWRAWPRLLTVSMLTVVVTLGTLTVTVLGDGLADVAKQGHLVYNAALAWWIATLVVAARTLLARWRRRVSNQTP